MAQRSRGRNAGKKTRVADRRHVHVVEQLEQVRAELAHLLPLLNEHLHLLGELLAALHVAVDAGLDLVLSLGDLLHRVRRRLAGHLDTGGRELAVDGDERHEAGARRGPGLDLTGDAPRVVLTALDALLHLLGYERLFHLLLHLVFGLLAHEDHEVEDEVLDGQTRAQHADHRLIALLAGDALHLGAELKLQAIGRDAAEAGDARDLAEGARAAARDDVAAAATAVVGSAEGRRGALIRLGRHEAADGAR